MTGLSEASLYFQILAAISFIVPIAVFLGAYYCTYKNSVGVNK